MELHSIYNPVREKLPHGDLHTAALGREFSNGAGHTKTDHTHGFTPASFSIVSFPQHKYHNDMFGQIYTRRIRRENLKGFTLIEILIGVSILVIILALGLITTFDSYKGYSFRSERALLVSTLEKARSRAINNFQESEHGVCFIAPHYIIFRGNTCTEKEVTNEKIPANTAIVVTGLSPTSPVIFRQLTGNIPELSLPTDEIEITITEGVRASIITINHEGTINW